ncbi:MAG TPA: hypothetical protein VFG07_07340 [Thermoplasmata archaeon]|nr:hypothetical protein [Thermoplasmata archaeon]
MAATTDTDARPLAHREAFLIILTAVVLAAALQIGVIAPAAGERLWALGLVVVLFAFVSFVYLGFWQRSFEWYGEWVIRRHIRRHRALVDELASAFNEYERLFRSGREFLSVGNRLMQSWLQESQRSGSPRNQPQRDSGTRAHAQLTAWSNGAAYATQLKGLLDWRIREAAYFDTYEFFYTARLFGVDFSRSPLSAQNFVNARRSAGIGLLPNYLADEWDAFAKKVNALVDLANAIGRRAPAEAGVDIGFGFKYVPDLYPRPGDPPSTDSPAIGGIKSPPDRWDPLPPGRGPRHRRRNPLDDDWTPRGELTRARYAGLKPRTWVRNAGSCQAAECDWRRQYSVT